MSFFNSVSKKVVTGYIVIAAVVAVMAYCLYEESSLIFDQKETFVQETLPTLRSVESAASNLSKIHVASFGLYGLTIELVTFQEQVKGYRAELDRNLDEISRAGLASRSQLSDEKDKIRQEVERLQSIMGAESTDWDAARESLGDIQMQIRGLQDILNGVKATASENAETASDMIRVC